MEYIHLNNSDLVVSRLCFGGCPMGGYGWGTVQENELIDAVNAAIDSGITFFDTADTYGLGQSEITLGRALKGKRNKVIIASKFGVRVKQGKPTFYDNSPEWIQKSIEGTLQRLGTDYLDLYQIHYRDDKIPLSVVVDSLELLKKQGKIRYYGLSNIYKKDIEEIAPFEGMFVSFQDEYSLAQRKNEQDIKTISNELKLTPMTWGSLGQGILTGKYNKNSTFNVNDRRSRDTYVNFHGKKLQKNLEIVDCLKMIAQNHQKPVAAVAIRFILDYLPDSVVLCGAKKTSQVISNSNSCDWNLIKDELMELLRVSE